LIHDFRYERCSGLQVNRTIKNDIILTYDLHWHIILCDQKLLPGCLRSTHPSLRALGIPHTTELVLQIESPVCTDGPVSGTVSSDFTDLKGNVPIKDNVPTQASLYEGHDILTECSRPSRSASRHVDDQVACHQGRS
jgi:hypothetical protein